MYSMTGSHLRAASVLTKVLESTRVFTRECWRVLEPESLVGLIRSGVVRFTGTRYSDTGTRTHPRIMGVYIGIGGVGDYVGRGPLNRF